MPPAPVHTPLIVIAGPTAVGKTAAGIALCRALDGELISADSMQVYRGLDIGTAKPTAGERCGVPCHLIDILDPTEEFSAARFCALAAAAAADIRARGRAAVMAGGTGLYLKSYLYGLFEQPSRDPAVRRQLRERLRADGPEALHRQLAAVDPAAAARIAPADRVRIERALEVFLVTGRPISSWQQQWRQPRPRVEHRLFILHLPRPQLYERINTRVDDMLRRGWVEEVRALLARYPDGSLHCFKSIGYREIAAHLRGEIPLGALAEEIKRQTRRFAKRQLTWFRRMAPARWIDVLGRSPEDVAEEIMRVQNCFAPDR
ncbi:MAG: tRNA (adenosine(37)-N6)-dimethylallyltransferase MiaA [Candidatus Sumerlaeia bacterium]